MTSVCQTCGYEIDIEGAKPFTTIKCGSCGAELAIPLIVGHLQLERRTDEIPCADMFHGFDLKTDKDVNALILKKNVTLPPEWHELVVSQARTIAGVTHPGILPLTGFGFLGGEFVATSPAPRGASLSKYDPNLVGPFKINSIVELMQSVASAMAEAHRQGVVHHDLSPSSVFIDSGRNPWVRDFLKGVLRYHYERGLGQTSSVSPYYISPEKAMGNPEESKGDVFSFGVMLYYLLTGRYPFQDDDEVTTIYSRIKADDPESEAPATPYKMLLNPFQVEYRKPIRPKDLRPKIQSELDTLIVRTLDPSPEERPAFDEIQQSISAILAASKAVEAEARQEGAKLAEIKKKMIGVTDTRSVPIMKNLAVDTAFGMPISTKAKFESSIRAK